MSLDLQVAQANSEFHGAIIRVAGNERLRSLIGELQDFFPKDYVWRAMTSPDEVRALNLDEHDRIRDALVRGSEDRARKEMRKHILHASKILLEYFVASDSGDDPPSAERVAVLGAGTMGAGIARASPVPAAARHSPRAARPRSMRRGGGSAAASRSSHAPARFTPVVRRRSAPGSPRASTWRRRWTAPSSSSSRSSRTWP